MKYLDREHQKKHFLERRTRPENKPLTGVQRNAIFKEVLSNFFYDLEGIHEIYMRTPDGFGGRSGMGHSFDITWRPTVDGEKQTILIDCNNYVEHGHSPDFMNVRDFSARLHDIQGHFLIVKGVMITNQFFDPDYLKYTRFYGINLLGVRAHNEMQWHSGIKKVILKTDSNQFVNSILVPDAIDVSERIQTTLGDAFFTDEEDYELSKFRELVWNLPRPDYDLTNLKHVYHLEKSYFEVEPYGKIKIKEVEVHYDHPEYEFVVANGIAAAEMIVRKFKEGKLVTYNSLGVGN